ncbi:MAG: AAA family ATPase [Gammaproteobacteria bacterium]|nr:AAA family ATPase [Gammaproteobacteria bacterium]
MYLEYFGLKQQPFQLTPDAEFLYMSPQHSEAKAHLDYAVMNRDSCVVISGDIGCGKTTLINRFVAELDENIRVARIFQTQLTARQFLQSLLVQFGFKPFRKNKAELLDTIRTFLLEEHAKGRQVVLIIDEAQNLSLKVLEEIRLLTDIETEKSKTINVVLCGQPELEEKLQTAGLEQFAQRIHFHVRLQPLSLVETSEYINFRLKVAGYDREDDLFPADVIPTIYRFSGGVPRLINTLCDTALTAAFVEEEDIISSDTIGNSLEELNWEPFKERTERKRAAPKDLTAVTPRLVLVREGTVLQKYKINSVRMVIGRDADNDIPVASEFISRHHAQISFYRDSYWVNDLKSTNGTFVNGRRIQRRRLANNDVIAIGHHRLIFQDANAVAQDDDDNLPTDISDFRGTRVIDEAVTPADRRNVVDIKSASDDS